MSKAKAIRFELQVEGLQERFELTKRSVRKAVRQALSEVGDIYRKAMQDRFESGGDGSWAPLSPATIRRKGHDKILIDKGLLPPWRHHAFPFSGRTTADSDVPSKSFRLAQDGSSCSCKARRIGNGVGS